MTSEHFDGSADAAATQPSKSSLGEHFDGSAQAAAAQPSKSSLDEHFDGSADAAATQPSKPSLTRDGSGLRLARALVAIAAVVVAPRCRSGFRREWEAELRVVSERGRPVVRPALGAFHHAFALRRHAPFAEHSARAHRLQHVRFSWLDVKLGLRMLVKYPGLSSISVIGMSVAIAIGVCAFSILSSMTTTSLPLPDGDRVVALRNTIVTEPSRSSATLRDFITWRGELNAMDDLAAFTTVARNLVVPGSPVELVRVARMTASGFTVARTSALRGRALGEGDERSDARVVVIGFDEWQRRFAADADILGRRIGLGNELYTIVGVMPEGFRFPVNDGYWIPFVIGPAEHARPDAVPVTIVGRLAHGETLEGAQAELSTIGVRMATSFPATHAGLRPRVLSYTRAFFDFDSPQKVRSARLLQLFISLLLGVVAVNVAILVYARTATRIGEIAVRTALGASRARVVTQLFAEALVLSLAAAVVGLAIAGTVLVKLQGAAARELGALPFWVSLGLSRNVVMYALVLAVAAAVIAGVLPALKATGRRVQSSLQQLSGSGARLQLGRVWTALIIAQVAVAVAVLPFAVHFTEEMIGNGTADPGYPVDEFLNAALALEHADGPRDTSVAYQRMLEERFSARTAELIQRLETDPAVVGVTLKMPADYERVELADVALHDPGTERIERVEADYFELHDMPLVAGRSFTEADARDGASVIIVNQVFAEDYLSTGGAIGHHLRIEDGPWLEIIGVVRDAQSYAFEPSSGIYLPADITRLSSPLSLAVRVRVEPAMSFAPRLRSIAAAVDPTLQLAEVSGAADRLRQARQGTRWIAFGAAAVTLSVLLLSAAGIYAMMSFTVARRRREIGIRSALGAAPRRVLGSIFARASAQLSAGILFGMIGTFALDRVTGKGPVNDGNAVMLLFVAVLMATVGLLAAIGPARGALAVQPTEALRED